MGRENHQQPLPGDSSYEHLLAPHATADPGSLGSRFAATRWNNPPIDPRPEDPIDVTAGDARRSGAVPGDRAVRLMELLGLSEDELCQILDVDPLTLLSGQLQHHAELPILLDLLEEAAERGGAPVLRRWVRAPGRSGPPIDALVRRDFAAFEDALGELSSRGFVLRGGRSAHRGTNSG